MDLVLKGDFILIKEVIPESKIEGTDLNIKYDDNEHFMVAEIIQVSEDLPLEYSKYYPILQGETIGAIKTLIAKIKPGAKVVLQRIAKVPYKDGLYFASFKDILAIITDGKDKPEEKKWVQMKLFESEND